MLLFTIFINDLIANSALSCASVTLDSMLYCMCIGYHLFAIGTFHIRTSGLFTCSIHNFFLSPKHILILRFKTFDFFWINFLNFCGRTSNPSPFSTSLFRKDYFNDYYTYKSCSECWLFEDVHGQNGQDQPELLNL